MIRSSISIHWSTLASSETLPESRATARTLLFRVAGKVYGCDIEAVREIIPYRRATRLPGAPPFVQGLVNLRGTIVTVLDLGARLDPARPPVRDGSIDADLAQRDFTINAMAVPLETGEPLLDPHGGRDDIERRLVRVLGERAYREDPLRTLRMARLACKLEFEVEPETRTLARRHAQAITSVAPERTFYDHRRQLLDAGLAEVSVETIGECSACAR